MRAITRVMSGAVLMLSLGAVPAVAQASFSLGAGLTFPSGALSEGINTGFHGLAGVSFVPGGSPVGIRVDGMYHRFGLDEDDVDANFQMLNGTASAVYRFVTSEESKIHPYVIGGLGLYNYKFTGDDVPDDFGSETDFGFNLGAGFDFAAGSTALFVEGRYHSVFSDGDNLKMIPITVGIRLGGS